jgi:preprotein translocase subunit SecA
MTRHELGETLFDQMKDRYEAKEQVIGDKQMRFHERMIMLSVLDGLWKDHLLNMDHLKEGIGLRGYAQQDPLVAYKKESFEMFEEMMGRFQEDTVRYLFLMQIVGQDGQPLVIPSRPRQAIPPAPPVPSADGNGHHPPPPVLDRPAVPIPTRRPSTTIDEIEQEFQRKKKRELEHARMAGGSAAEAPTQRRTGDKVGRNDPCPCGSGKKYKKCHGANEA